MAMGLQKVPLFSLNFFVLIRPQEQGNGNLGTTPFLTRARRLALGSSWCRSTIPDISRPEIVIPSSGRPFQLFRKIALLFLVSSSAQGDRDTHPAALLPRLKSCSKPIPRPVRIHSQIPKHSLLFPVCCPVSFSSNAAYRASQPN